MTTTTKTSQPKCGDKVRSTQHGTVGYWHHTSGGNKAWVSDSPDGSCGQYYHVDDLEFVSIDPWASTPAEKREENKTLGKWTGSGF